MKPLRYLSLCSGIEAASVAFLPLGWQCVAVAEIEPFPCAVLKHHYPDVPNLGDINKITKQQIKKLGHIDLVIYGFPCQDLSVAGQRKGLKHADGTHTRSGLFYRCARIVDWSGARWSVAENVPGLFSHDAGRSFASVVGELAGAEFGVPRDGWRNSGVALGPKGLVEWFVLDAQYDHLAQRRERVFIVRDTGDWAGRPPFLLKPESLCWHTAPRRETRERIAPSLSARAKGGDGLGTDAEIDGAVIPINMQAAAKNGVKLDENLVCATLTKNYATHHGRMAGNNGCVAENQLIPDIVPQTMSSKGSKGSSGPAGDEVANMIPVAASTSGSGYWREGIGALRGREQDSHENLVAGMAVRRLTPKECSRLQGFPDTYLELIYADAKEAHAAQVLHELWSKAGTPTVEKQEWRTGIAASLLTPKILLAGVYGAWISWEMAARCADASRQIPGQNGYTEGFVRCLRQAGQARYTPQRRESFEQCAWESGSSVSELPLEETQARKVLRDFKLWPEAQRTWPLRYALATPAQIKTGKLNPDGPRYKTLGNAMAVPVIRWIGQRLQLLNDL